MSDFSRAQMEVNHQNLATHERQMLLWERQQSINETHQFLIIALLVLVVGLTLVCFALYNGQRNTIEDLEYRIDQLDG